MILRDSLFGDDFALNSGYILPTFAYYGTYYFTVHSQVLFFLNFKLYFIPQVWGSVMISVNRYVTVCQPLSKIARHYDRIDKPVLYSINIIVPFLMMFRMLFQGSVYYYRTPTGELNVYTPMPIVRVSSFDFIFFG